MRNFARTFTELAVPALLLTFFFALPFFAIAAA